MRVGFIGLGSMGLPMAQRIQADGHELTVYARRPTCDNTVRQRGPEHRDDTVARLVPGEGEVPLVDIVAALPAHVPVGLEVPMRPAAEAGEATEDRVRRCLVGARTVLAVAVAKWVADQQFDPHDPRSST